MEKKMLRRTKAGKHWQQIGASHHHGICLPLSALHSDDTGGIGEFQCLIPVIEWCAALGMDVVQLLPINDTGNDPSPYSLYSAFALNPVYLNVNEYASRSDRKRLKALNQLEWVDYEKVRNAKLSILWKAYQKKKSGAGNVSPWMKSYAYWMAGGDPKIEKFYRFVQQLCFSQMKKVRRFAEKKNVLLKGDLPILISSSSVDCKERPELFIQELSVGAPPDEFSASGQNWGFPAYDYEGHLSEIEHWWKERLDTAEQLYHLYRIDHAVGFFRLWTMEEGKSGKEGTFLPKSPKKWRKLGKRLFSHFLEWADMLPIAEDLGSVPPLVREELLKLGIPGTKVMRWEKSHPKNYPSCSMTTVSTHDTETLKQWWERNSQEARKFCEQTGLPWNKRMTRDLRKGVLKVSHHSNSLFHINLLQEYFPLARGLSWPGQDHERINIPGARRKNNWRYRFKPTIQEFTENTELSAEITQLLS